MAWGGKTIARWSDFDVCCLVVEVRLGLASLGSRAPYAFLERAPRVSPVILALGRF